MADHEFSFSIELSGRPASLDLLRAVASRVLQQIGCGADAVPTLLDGIETAAARGATSASGFRVQFVARDGRLDIAVSSSGGSPWQTSYRLA